MLMRYLDAKVPGFRALRIEDADTLCAGPLANDMSVAKGNLEKRKHLGSAT